MGGWGQGAVPLHGPGTELWARESTVRRASTLCSPLAGVEAGRSCLPLPVTSLKLQVQTTPCKGVGEGWFNGGPAPWAGSHSEALPRSPGWKVSGVTPGFEGRGSASPVLWTWSLRPSLSYHLTVLSRKNLLLFPAPRQALSSIKLVAQRHDSGSTINPPRPHFTGDNTEAEMASLTHS